METIIEILTSKLDNLTQEFLNYSKNTQKKFNDLYSKLNAFAVTLESAHSKKKPKKNKEPKERKEEESEEENQRKEEAIIESKNIVGLHESDEESDKFEKEFVHAKAENELQKLRKGEKKQS